MRLQRQTYKATIHVFIIMLGLVSAGVNLVPSPAHAQKLISPIPIGDSSLQIYGWMWEVLSNNCGSRDNTCFDWATFKVRAVWNSKEYGAFFEADLEDAVDSLRGDNSSQNNWLRRAWFTIKLAETEYASEWKLNIGRLFTAAGGVYPSPNDLVPIFYPRHPFGSYAYGLQVNGKIEGGIEVWADVGFRSGYRFDAAENFDGIESSMRLRWDFKRRASSQTSHDLPVWFPGGDTTFATQISSMYKRISLESGFNIRQNLRASALVYVDEESAVLEENESEETINSHGIHAFAVWKPIAWIDLHSLLDLKWGHEQLMSASKHSIWANGITFRWPNDQFSATLDLITTQWEETQVVLRGEIQF